MIKLTIYIVALVGILGFAAVRKVSDQGSSLKHYPAPTPAYCEYCQEFVCDQSADACITLALTKVAHGKSRMQRPTILRMTNTLYNEFDPKPTQFYNIGVLTVVGAGREFWLINRFHSRDKRYNIHVTVSK